MSAFMEYLWMDEIYTHKYLKVNIMPRDYEHLGRP